MTKISILPDCVNSPRKRFVTDILVAIAEGDDSRVLELVPHNIVWDVVGKSKKIGAGIPFHKSLETSVLWKSKTLKVGKIITHGADASANGTVTTRSGTGWAFCHVISFSGAGGFKVKNITSYIIAT